MGNEETIRQVAFMAWRDAANSQLYAKFKGEG